MTLLEKLREGTFQPHVTGGCSGCADTAMSEAADEIERLQAKIAAAMQRLNESGTGEMGLIETIHAVHSTLAK